MRLKTPSFWYAPRGLAAFLMTPFCLLYAAGHMIRQWAGRPFHAALPVLCIGNLVAGGSGKTPAAIALMDIIKKERLAAAPGFLTRGYGGMEQGPALIDLQKQSPRETGDEPRLLARHGPVILSRNRKSGALFAKERGLDLLVMDDGLQNPALHKDIRFIVIDGASGFGNALLLPAGPLRDSLRHGLKQADAFILIGEDRHNVRALLPESTPVFQASLSLAGPAPQQDAPYVAFCGLGRPEKFRATLEAAGARITSWHAYPDHHVFTARDIGFLAKKAQESGARLITTEKDAARLAPALQASLPLDTLPVRLLWEDESLLSAFLRQKLKGTP